MSASAPTGCTTPISLLTSIAATSSVPGTIAARAMSRSTIPSCPTGSTVTARPRAASAATVSSTAACSVASVTMPPVVPLIAQLSASVAPLVKATRPPVGNSRATSPRATSTAALAVRPARCGECGLANPSRNHGSIASSASGASGVVA